MRMLWMAMGTWLLCLCDVVVVGGGGGDGGVSVLVAVCSVDLGSKRYNVWSSRPLSKFSMLRACDSLLVNARKWRTAVQNRFLSTLSKHYVIPAYRASQLSMPQPSTFVRCSIAMPLRHLMLSI